MEYDNKIKHLISYLKECMSSDTDYLDADKYNNKTSDLFEFHAFDCDVSPFVFRNWVIGRGNPDWNKVLNVFDKSGVAYIKGK